METDRAASLQEKEQTGSPTHPNENVSPVSSNGLGRLITSAEMERHPGNTQFKRLPGV